VTGGIGTGKTLFSLQFAVNQIKAGENVLYISFDENSRRLTADAAAMGWDLDAYQKQGKMQIVTIEPISNPDFYSQISKTITQYGISIVVVDSVSEMALAFQDNIYRLRRELYVLSDLLHKHDCTTLITAEVPGEASLDAMGGGTLTRDGITEFVVDTVITLHNAGIGGEGDRAIRVLKMRRTQHVREPIGMKITNKGLVVG